MLGSYLADPTLGRLLELEGTGGSTIPLLRYIEVNLQIPGIKNCIEYILLLVIPTMTYSEKIPVMVGSKIIDWAMRIIRKGELTKWTMTWKQGHFGAVIAQATTAAPHWFKCNWDGKGGDPLPPKELTLHRSRNSA